MLLLTVEAHLACRPLGVRKAEIRENALLLVFSPDHLPERDVLAALPARAKFPTRFLYGSGSGAGSEGPDDTALQLRVDLNPPRRGDPVALTEMATEVLGRMMRAD